MKLNRLIAIPGLALTAGLSLAACGSTKAPASSPVAVTHMAIASAAEPKPSATKSPPKATPASPQAVALPKVATNWAVDPPNYAVEPTEISTSADGTGALTGITWSSWTAHSAEGSGAISLDNGVPNMAQGTKVSVPVSIALSSPVNGSFIVMTAADSSGNKNTYSLNGRDTYGLGADDPSSSAPAAGLTDCGGDVYAGGNTSCPFALNVEANYTGLGVDYANSPVTGQDYTMNCVAGYGNLNGGDSVVCTGGDNALVEWGAN